MAPWLKDEEGNDVFDDVNSPLSGKPIFDPIDVTETLGSNPVTRTIDDVDAGLRNIGATTPAAITAASGTAAVDEASEMDDSDRIGFTWDEALNVAADRDPDADDPPGQGATKALLVVAVAAVALWLLRPLLEIGANVSE